MTHGPDYRIGGVRRQYPARALEPGDAFDRVQRVISVEHDHATSRVAYTFEVFDLSTGQLLTAGLTDDAEEILDVYRQPRWWSPLAALSVAARAGLRLPRLYERFRMFSMQDRRYR